MSLRFFVIAGEQSGDVLGARLMRALKKKFPKIYFSGIGGPLMEAEGIKSFVPMDALSVIGLTAILYRYRSLSRYLSETIETIIAQNPDIVVTIDSQEFSLRVMRGVKARAPHIRIVHYVVPTVWAWRPRRAEKLAKVADQLLALFPFEPPYFERYGVRCDFVGHPVAGLPLIGENMIVDFKQKFNLNASDPLFIVLPGSRISEIVYHMPILKDTLTRLSKRYPNMRVMVPVVENLAEIVKRKAVTWPGNPLFINAENYGEAGENLKYTALGAADLALAASGTAALELAAARTPMVVFYKMNWLSYILVLLLKKINRACLVNIILQKDVVPELIGRKCQAALIEKEAVDILQNSDHQKAQINAMNTVMNVMGQDMEETPSMRAACAIFDGLNHK